MANDNLIVPLFRVKEGGKFQYLNYLGFPEGPTYIKGRPHTNQWLEKSYVTKLYAPGEPAHKSFTGYSYCNTMVKVESAAELKPIK